MSDDLNQGDSNADNNFPPQENFGTPFPNAAEFAQQPAYPQPPQQPAYTAWPGQAPYPYGPPPSYGYGIPPQGGYGNPQAAPPPSSPLPFWQAVRQLPGQYWRILTKPGAAIFNAEQGKAAWNIVWAQLLGLSTLASLMVLVILILYGLFLRFIFQSIASSSSTPTMPAGILDQATQIFWIVALISMLATFILQVGGFFASTGIYYLLSKAFGGQGKFLTQCYGSLLISAPIGILTPLLIIIPGGTLAASVYNIILHVFMTMSVHRLSGGKATAVVLIPVITVFVLYAGFMVVYFYFIFKLMPHSYSFYMSHT